MIFESKVPNHGETLTNGRFAGYDSPELATLVSHTNKVDPWIVRSGDGSAW